jgi:hypothetical protein
MAGYFENYRAGEERRNRLILRGILALILLCILSVAGYYFFRNRSESQKLETFRQLLEQKKYEEAYAFWGCTPEKPCRYYAYEKFLRDWGPESGITDWKNMKRVRKVTCTDGYGEGWKFGEGPDQTVHLWVVREDQSLSFDPWPNWRQTWLAAALNNCSGMTRGLSVQQ